MTSLFRSYIVNIACRRFSNINEQRQARMLDRMIKKSVVKKVPHSIEPKKFRQEFLVSAYENEGKNRKIVALNKFYMEQILELTSSGPFATEINQLGIEISKVRLTPCRSTLYVFWITTKDDAPHTELTEVLQKMRTDLQSQMGLLRNMRRIPIVTFIKDVRLEKIRNVEKLFEVADFGSNIEDNIAKETKSDLDLEKESELQKKGKLENKQTALGLDHAKIKESIEKDIRRFQAININKSEIEEVRYVTPTNLAVFNMKTFSNFYRRKLYLDKKFRKREYDESVVTLNGPYDPEEEIEKYWKNLKIDDFIEDEEEMKDDENYYFNEEDREEHDVELRGGSNDNGKDGAYNKEELGKESLDVKENNQ